GDRWATGRAPSARAQVTGRCLVAGAGAAAAAAAGARRRATGRRAAPRRAAAEAGTRTAGLATRRGATGDGSAGRVVTEVGVGHRGVVGSGAGRLGERVDAGSTGGRDRRGGVADRERAVVVGHGDVDRAGLAVRAGVGASEGGAARGAHV